MRFVVFIGVLLGTGYLVTVTPWWAQAWFAVFWLALYIGSLRSAWRQMIIEAQAAATAKQLMKDADDTTPLDVNEITDPLVGFTVIVIIATAVFASLLWFTWS